MATIKEESAMLWADLNFNQESNREGWDTASTSFEYGFDMAIDLVTEMIQNMRDCGEPFSVTPESIQSLKTKLSNGNRNNHTD